MSTHRDELRPSMNRSASHIGDIIVENGNRGNVIHIAAGPYNHDCYRLVMEVGRGWFERPASGFTMDRMAVINDALKSINRYSGAGIVEYTRPEGEVAWSRLWTPRRGIEEATRAKVDKLLMG